MRTRSNLFVVRLWWMYNPNISISFQYIFSYIICLTQRSRRVVQFLERGLRRRAGCPGTPRGLHYFPHNTGRAGGVGTDRARHTRCQPWDPGEAVLCCRPAAVQLLRLLRATTGGTTGRIINISKWPIVHVHMIHS